MTPLLLGKGFNLGGRLSEMGVANIILRVPGVRALVGRMSRWYRAEVERELREHGALSRFLLFDARTSMLQNDN